MAQDGTFLPGTGPAELFLTSGDTGAKLRRRALWLLRAADLGAIDLTKVRVCIHQCVSLAALALAHWRPIITAAATFCARIVV